MKKFLLFFLFWVAMNWPPDLMAQSFAVGDPNFRVISLPSVNDTLRLAVITYRLPDVTLRTRTENRKIFYEHVNISVDSIMDTITTDRSVTDNYLVAAYCQAGQALYEGPTFTREQKNVGPLLLKKQVNRKQTDTYYRYQADKKYVQMVPLETSSSQVKWDWWLISALIVLLLSTVVIAVIEKKLKAEAYEKLPAWIDLIFANLTMTILVVAIVALFIILCCQWLIFIAIVVAFLAHDLILCLWRTTIGPALKDKPIGR